MNGHLRIGACLSLSGKFARFGSQAAQGLDTWRSLDGNADIRRPAPPRQVCAVAAAVREFSHAIDHPNGVFGIAQWFAGRGHEVALGPSEADLVDAYADCAGTMPDYPAVQVAAGALSPHRCPASPA
jgi:hypothetical protein